MSITDEDSPLPPSLPPACAQVKKEEAGSIHVVKQRQLHLNCDIISLSVSTSRARTEGCRFHLLAEVPRGP